MTKRLHLISGPRNISTALMYSFGQRLDTTVVDEPLYAHYLKHTGAMHPGRDEVLAAMETDANRVIEGVMLADYPTPNVFLKNMAHHMLGVDQAFLAACENIFLIRDPKKLIASFALVIEKPTLLDIGLAESERLFTWIKENTGKIPVVINSDELLKNPKVYLQKVCTALAIPFDKGMLRWPAGPRIEDGIWAIYWYSSVHKSIGFAPQRSEGRVLRDDLLPLYEEALPYFDALNKHAITL